MPNNLHRPPLSVVMATTAGTTITCGCGRAVSDVEVPTHWEGGHFDYAPEPERAVVPPTTMSSTGVTPSSHAIAVAKAAARVVDWYHDGMKTPAPWHELEQAVGAARAAGVL